MSSHMFFSIITSTYNAAGTLPRLLDSLASQTCHNFNWIVQDGGSTDGTMEIVERYRGVLPEILSDSCQDNGIYNAWNRAIISWQSYLGEWILFLGADDLLAEDTVLETVQKKIQNDGQDRLFACGNVIIFDTRTMERCSTIYGRTVTFSRRYRGMPLPHTAFFARRQFFVPFCFDERFKISGDYDFILRNWRAENQLLELDMIISKMGNSGISHNKSTLYEDFLAIRKTSQYLGMMFLFLRLIEAMKAFCKPVIVAMPFGKKIYAAYRKIFHFE